MKTMSSLRGAEKKRTGRNSFKDSWLDGVDVNGDSPKSYVVKTSNYTFKCSWCQSWDISVDNNGKAGLIQHFKSKKHRDIANLRSGRKSDQIIFDTQTDVNRNPSASINDEEVDEDGLNDGDGLPSKGETRGIKNFFKPCDNRVAIPPSDLRMSLDSKAVCAEIRIALKAVESDWSYRSLDNMCEFLADLAPDSNILKKVQFKRSKLSYIISHGLGPHFHDLLVKDLKDAPSFTLGLDSATTKQGGLTKSLDFKVRYFSARHGMVR